MDDNDNQEPGSSSSASSAAERLRQRRRQRILANQGSRLDKILGTDSTDSKTKRTAPNKEKNEDPSDEDIAESWKSLSKSTGLIEEVDNNGVGVTIIRKKQTDSTSSHDEHLIRSGNGSGLSGPSTSDTTSGGGSTSGTTESIPSPQGFFRTEADGSTTHPKISTVALRLFLCLLGVLLPLFNGRYLLVTFFSWEFAVFCVNGLPNEESPSSILILLVALMGLKDRQLERLKFIMKLSNCLITDISIFIVCALIPRLVF